MDEMTTSISDLLATLIRKGKQIILIGVAFAALLGAYKAFASYHAFRNENRLDLEQLEYEQTLLKLERTIEKATEDAVKKKDYIENSLWMDVDPYNKYTARLYLSISGVDEHSLNMSFGQDETPVDYLTQRIATQYRILWNSLDLPSELKIARYENVLDKYVREVVSMDILEGGMLQITAIGNSESEVKESADAVHSLLSSLASTVEKSSYSHNLEEFRFVVKNQIDTEMANSQVAQYDQLDSYNDTIIDTQHKIKKVNAPDSILAAVIKMAIIGGVAGVILACVWYVGKALMQGVLQSSSQVEQVLGISYIGSVATNKGLFIRLGNLFSGERVWKDESQALGYIAETVKMRAADKKLLLISSLPLKQCTEAADKLQSALVAAGMQTDCVGDFSHDPDALVKLGKCDALMLLEAVDTSKLSGVNEIHSFAKELEKPVIGFVMI